MAGEDADTGPGRDGCGAIANPLGSYEPAPGEERVLYAGLPEHEAYQDRSVNGIPYHPEVIAWFKKNPEGIQAVNAQRKLAVTWGNIKGE